MRPLVSLSGILTDMTVIEQTPIRHRLFEAATSIFAQKGYHATRVSDIVKEGGVAQGTFYLYFTNKEVLFTELVQTFFARLLQDTLEAYQPASTHDADDITRIIRSIWRVLLHRFQQERSMVLIILREAGAVGPAFAAEIQSLYEHVIAGLTFYAQQWMVGQLRPLNVQLVGWVVLGMAERAAYFVASSQEALDLDHFADELTLVSIVADFRLFCTSSNVATVSVNTQGPSRNRT